MSEEKRERDHRKNSDQMCLAAMYGQHSIFRRDSTMVTEAKTQASKGPDIAESFAVEPKGPTMAAPASETRKLVAALMFRNGHKIQSP